MLIISQITNILFGLINIIAITGGVFLFPVLALYYSIRESRPGYQGKKRAKLMVILIGICWATFICTLLVWGLAMFIISALGTSV